MMLPPEIQMAQAHADLRYDNLRRAFLRTLEDIRVDDIDQMSEIPDRYIETLDGMERDFQKTIRSITIAPQLTDAERNTIAAEWGQNLDKYVRGLGFGSHSQDA